MPQSSETQIRVQAVRDLIRQGLSNDEIREALPQYDLHPEMLRSNRRKLKIANPTPLMAVQKCVVMRRDFGRRCPKCGGYAYAGSCINCGLSNESAGYRDLIRGEVVSL